MKRSYLFVLWAGGGNVGPQIVVARKLAARGHTVRVLAPAALRHVVEGAGLVFEPYRTAPEHDESRRDTSLIRDFEAKTPVGAVGAARDRLIAGTAAAFAADVLDVLERRDVDAVVFDYLLVGAGFAAEKAGVPAVALVHHIYPFPAQGAPPFGMGWRPATGALGRVRDAVGNAGFRQMMVKPLLGPLNAVRRDLGLTPLQDTMDAFTNLTRVLVLTSAAFDFPAARPAVVTYVGPQLNDLAAPAEGNGDARPLVVVGLSTTFQGQDDLLGRVVRALGGLPVRALVGTGPATLPFPPPGNVDAQPFVPHEQVIPSADLVITHAGHGTVMTALAAGVPLVCLPIARDQPDVAARVVHAGAGLRLRPGASSEKIARAITTVLGDSRFRAGARRLQAPIHRDLAEDRAVAELEHVGAAPGLPAEHNLR